MDLSEQFILDCTQNPDDCGGTGGCSGGTQALAYENIISSGGIPTEWQYPYQSYFGMNYNCRANQTNPEALLLNYTLLPVNELNPILYHLANNGPLSVSVDASAWGAYESGVFAGCNLTNPDIDHAVQLVGYGTDPQYGPYWLIRNSWAVSFGEMGYIRIQRYTENQTPCGTDIHPSDGLGCKNGPPKVTVCGNCGILYDATFVAIDEQS